MKWAALSLAFALSACAKLPSLTPQPPPLPIPPPAPQETYDRALGSLWLGDASRRFLAFENRAKRVGDLVTVRIEEEAQAENEASTKLERTSTYEATLDSDVALQTLISKPIRTILSLLGLTDQRNDSNPTTPLDIVESETTSDFEGKGKLKREATFTTTIACVVTEVTSAGLLRIEGERQLKINNETQIIRLLGYVRPEDIQIDNTIASTFVASADIQYGGVGAVSGKQKAPWLMTLFDRLLPF